MNQLIPPHLLWKELRLLKQIAVSLTAAVILLELVLAFCFLRFGIGTNSSDSAELDSINAFMIIGSLTPLFAALAAAAILFGEERRSGTWHWNSILPIHWTQGLVTKLVASILFCFVAFACALLTTYVISFIFPDKSLFLSDLQSAKGALVGSILLNLPSLFLLSTLACLLFREPLNALATSMLTLLAVNWFIIGMSSSFNTYGSTDRGLVAFLVSHVVFDLGLLLAVVVTFRHSWHHLSSPLETWRQTRSSISLPRKTLNWEIAETPKAHSALLWQSRRQSWLVQFLIGFGILGVLAILPGPTEPTVLAIASSLLACLCGFASFANDQSAASYRFLADRGISPVRVWLARSTSLIGLTAGCVLAVGLAWLNHVGWRHLSVDRELFNLLITLPLVVFAIVVFFSLGQTCAMITERLITGLFTAMLLFFVIMFCTTTLITETGWISVFPIAVVSLVLILSPWYFLRRLFERGPSGSAVRFGVLIASIVVGLIMLYPFLRIYSVPWAGIPTHSVDVLGPSKLPNMANFPAADISIGDLSSLAGMVPDIDAEDESKEDSETDPETGSEAGPSEGTNKSATLTELKAFLDGPGRKTLQSLRNHLDTSPARSNISIDFTEVRSVKNWIEWNTLLLAAAIRVGDKQLAIETIAVLKKLLPSNSVVDLWPLVQSGLPLRYKISQPGHWLLKDLTEQERVELRDMIDDHELDQLFAGINMYENPQEVRVVASLCRSAVLHQIDPREFPSVDLPPSLPGWNYTPTNPWWERARDQRLLRLLASLESNGLAPTVSLINSVEFRLRTSLYGNNNRFFERFSIWPWRIPVRSPFEASKIRSQIDQELEELSSKEAPPAQPGESTVE